MTSPKLRTSEMVLMAPVAPKFSICPRRSPPPEPRLPPARFRRCLRLRRHRRNRAGGSRGSGGGDRLGHIENFGATGAISTISDVRSFGLVIAGHRSGNGCLGSSTPTRPAAATILPSPRRCGARAVSYTHLRAHETGRNLVCRLLLDKKT